MLNEADLKKKLAKWSDPEHPFRLFMSRMGDKWTLLVFITLLSKPKNRARFTEIKNEIPGISQRMLTQTLRNLERDGLVTRHVFAEVPPRVEYQLTEMGHSLRQPIKSLMTWLFDNWPHAKKFREKYY